MPHLTLVSHVSRVNLSSRSACLWWRRPTRVYRAAHPQLRQSSQCGLSPHVVSGVVAAATLYNASISGLVSSVALIDIP